MPPAAPVARRLSRRGGESHQRALRRVDGRQPARRRPEAAERRVPAGVEDHDVELRARSADGLHDGIGVERLDFELGLGVELGIDRDQIVRAAELHAMAGIIDQRYRFRPRHLQLGGEIRKGPLHRALIRVDDARHLEPLGLQHARQQAASFTGLVSVLA